MEKVEKTLGRPCTLALNKHHVTVTKQVSSKQTNGYKKPPANTSAEDKHGDSHFTLSYKAEKEYYQLVYLSKTDRNYGTLSEGEREESPTTPDIPRDTACTFPSGCYADSFAFCVFRNLTVIGVAVMLIQTGFISIQTLQSTIHAHAGLGVISISCTYIATIITCFLASALLTSFSQRVILVIVALSSSVYFACNMVPEEHMYVLIPGSSVFGLSQGLMWVSMMAYVTRVAQMYARKHELDRNVVLSKFTGIVFGIISISHILAHVLSGVYFSLLPLENRSYSALDTTHTGPKQPLINANQSLSQSNSHSSQSTGFVANCGAQYVNPYSPAGDLHSNSTVTSAESLNSLRPVPYKLWVIYCSLCVLLSLLAILVTLVLLKHLPHAECCNPSQVALRGSFRPLRGLAVTARDPRLQLLCPLILFTALKHGFVLADYTKAYVECALAVERIGLVMLCYGSVCTVGSFFVALVLQHLKRYVIIVAGTVFEIGNMVVLYWWTPHKGDEELFYVVAVCMGVCDAIWNTQLNALLGNMFAATPVSAFAVHRIVFSSGLCLAFAYSHFLGITTKLYIMTCTLVLGVGLYGVVELKDKMLANLSHVKHGDMYANQLAVPNDL